MYAAEAGLDHAGLGPPGTLRSPTVTRAGKESGALISLFSLRLKQLCRKRTVGNPVQHEHSRAPVWEAREPGAAPGAPRAPSRSGHSTGLLRRTRGEWGSPKQGEGLGLRVPPGRLCLPAARRPRQGPPAPQGPPSRWVPVEEWSPELWETRAGRWEPFPVNAPRDEGGPGPGVLARGNIGPAGARSSLGGRFRGGGPSPPAGSSASSQRGGF